MLYCLGFVCKYNHSNSNLQIFVKINVMVD